MKASLASVYGAGYVELDCSGRMWELSGPLIPPSKVRSQGGGTQNTPDETLLAAIVYVRPRPLHDPVATRVDNHPHTR